ncbi:MAG: UvrD-helicase domain-containing protein [Caldilineaceae bacterium]
MNQVAVPSHAVAVPAQPLTESQAVLVHLLDQSLAPPWEIYLRPFLNGDRPTVAALHPSAGLTIFEIIDWDLRHYRREQRGRYPRYQERRGSSYHTVVNPARMVEYVVENLLNVYVPYIGETITRDRRALSPFRVGLFFPTVNTHAAQTFAPLPPGRGVVFGRDAVENGDLALLLPTSHRIHGNPLPAEWLRDLRFWLAPPFHVAGATPTLHLTEEQRRHIEPAPGKHQRLHGVVGSGKSLVIAQRAAQLAAAGKRVLIVTFNVTLWQYLRQLVAATNVDFAWEKIEFHYFHGFCKNFLTENGIPWPLTSNRVSKQLLDEMVPSLVAQALQAGQNIKNRAYDAILIDEGQDFSRTYYDMLCHFLTDNDEVLLVADRRQNIYLRDDSWLEQMSGTKFRGRWRELKTSYRLSTDLAQEANRFAEQFLPAAATTPVTSAQASPEAQPHLAWHNVTTFEQLKGSVYSALQWLIKDRHIKPADIVILTPNQRDGWNLIRYLEQRNLAVNHVLAEDDGRIGRKVQRYRKRTFAAADQRIKLSTIHSFKGWELNNVILVTPENDRFWEAQSPYLFYVAMTRASQNLIVLNRHVAYQSYGAQWPTLRVAGGE